MVVGCVGTVDLIGFHQIRVYCVVGILFLHQFVLLSVGSGKHGVEQFQAGHYAIRGSVLLTLQEEVAALLVDKKLCADDDLLLHLDKGVDIV